MDEHPSEKVAPAAPDPSVPFISAIEPFLYGRPITYVDAGAYRGSVFEALLASSVRVREAHLIEPNPATFRALEENVAQMAQVASVAVTCHNVALSDRPGTVAMREGRDMTRVLAPAVKDGGGEEPTGSPAVFEARATTLDALARESGIERIGLLKIDVEGHELAVLEGARRLLESGSVDVVYVEAGIDPGSNQQTYYRAIEDALAGHGYRLFGIYEQVHEWLEDSPLLRRVNLAFMSARFAADNPFRLSRELFALRGREKEQEREIAGLRNEIAALEGKVSALEEEAAAAAALRDRVARQEATIARYREEIVALDGQYSASLAEVSTALAESRQLAGRLREERDAFVAYGDTLAQRYSRVLKSTSWRMTAFYRALARGWQRLTTGKRAGKVGQLPRRPTLGDAPPPEADT